MFLKSYKGKFQKIIASYTEDPKIFTLETQKYLQTYEYWIFWTLCTTMTKVEISTRKGIKIEILTWKGIKVIKGTKRYEDRKRY